jgi:hypothetical protein
MPLKKRKQSTPPEPNLRRSRLANRSRKALYVERTDSDDDSAHEPSLTVRNALKARQNRNRPEDSEDSYLDDSQEGDDGNVESEHLEHTAESDESQAAELCNDSDEEAPPVVTFVPLEKMRDSGGIEYVDFKIHPNSLLFLNDLKVNNNRAWLKGNRDANYIDDR